jgi:signal transduction histidine kinase
MPDGGQLTIRSAMISNGDVPGALAASAPAYVMIEVADSGSGIDERVREHLFEPFMTTKEPGGGSGLGLAVTYGIVQSHNGFINVESHPKQGTKLQIFLPVAEP